MIGEEHMYGDILLTKTSKKPPVFSLEKHASDGSIIKAALIKAPPGLRGWVLHLGKTATKSFRIKRAALDFFARVVLVKEEEKAS